LAIAKLVGIKTRNTETKVVLAKIGGGNAAGVAPGRFSTLSDVNTIITAMKREYSTCDYRFVAVACSISLLCFNV
jgi:hypothetical protein